MCGEGSGQEDAVCHMVRCNNDYHTDVKEQQAEGTLLFTLKDSDERNEESADEFKSVENYHKSVINRFKFYLPHYRVDLT